MKKATAFLMLVALSFAAAPAFAQTETPSPAPLTQVFDDAAVHFDPAKDWFRLGYPLQNASEAGKLTIVAMYGRNLGKDNEQRMLLEMEQFGGNVADWESHLENELRSQYEDVLIRKSDARLENGMPALWLNLTFGSGFDTQKIYGYAVSDGRRGIFMGVLGRLGRIDENETKDALKGLKVVLYPAWKP